MVAGKKSTLNYTFAFTGRSVYIELCNRGGQGVAGVNWQRCRGESVEEWHRPGEEVNLKI